MRQFRELNWHLKIKFKKDKQGKGGGSREPAQGKEREHIPWVGLAVVHNHTSDCHMLETVSRKLLY